MGVLGQHSISRRAFAGLLAAATMRGADAGIPALSWSEEGGAACPQWSSRYRATAQVLILGMSLLRRENVGGGSVVWRESAGAGPRSRLLEFTGYSSPERAAGLNRVGLIREMRLESNGTPEFFYFGFMTSSPEESAEAARKALHSSAREQSYSVIDGRVGPGMTQCVVAHFSAPASEVRTALLDRARQAVGSGTRQPLNPGPPAGTFLQTLADGILRRDTSELRYIYSGRSYRMRLSFASDPNTAAAFARRGVEASGDGVLRITGHTRREAGGKESEFRLWVPELAERPVPLRIEYQPKSYLRLVFDLEA